MTRALLVSCIAIASACASPPPMGCSPLVDSSGRGLPFCRGENRIPVCDDEGAMAHFTGTRVSSLTDGELAECDASNELVCPDRTVLPRCIPGPVSEP